MGLAGKLSDDPMLLQLPGSRFKVIVDYDVLGTTWPGHIRALHF